MVNFDIYLTHHISHIPLKVKLCLYEAAVCSLLTYGCETWNLDAHTIRRINGANSTMIARFTGQSIHTRPLTTSFDLVKKIRGRRFRWLTHIVRVGPSSIMFQTLEYLTINIPWDSRVIYLWMSHPIKPLMTSGPLSVAEEGGRLLTVI